MQKLKLYFLGHKIIGTIIILAIIGGGYWTYGKLTSKAGATLYVTAKAATGTIIASVTDSGQMAASDQLNIQPQVSGILTYVGVKPGDIVPTSKLLFSIDDTTAQKAVRDAELSLETAQNSLAISEAQNSADNLNTALSQSYDDGFSSVSNAFLDLPGIMNGFNTIFFNSVPGSYQRYVDWYVNEVSNQELDQAKTYEQNFMDSYNLALTAYDTNFTTFKTTDRTADSAAIEALISQTYDTTKLISDAVKNASSYLDFVTQSLQNRDVSVPSVISANQTSLNNYTSQINSNLSALLTATTNITNNKNAFTNTGLNTQSLNLGIQQKQNALQDAKDNLAYYSIYAPFNGTISSVPAQKGDNVGSGTTLATLITTEQIANVTLNEVDVAKIQLGDKVTLTFNAIPGLTVTGKVIQIDSVGTVSSGVVNYNVEIGLDDYDNEIKPGMSVNASIITDVEQNVLTVPNSAVKTSGGSSYVQIFSAPLPAPLPGVQGSTSAVPPTEKTVVVGISNATSTEIVSGLNIGDEVVTRTISPSSAAATTTTPSILGSAGGGRGGGAVRIP